MSLTPTGVSGKILESITCAGGTRVGGVIVSLIGAVALTGWLTASRALSSAGAGRIPVAPNTAVLFVLMGIAVCLHCSPILRARHVARAVTGLCLLVAGTRLAEYITGADFGVDGWLFSFPSESFGLAPIGKMAFFTAFSLLLASLALGAQTFQRKPRYIDDLARALALAVTLVGVIFSLGYLYHAPLLYGTRSIPMALPTAVAFVVLGLSIAIPSAVRDHGERREAQRALRTAHDDLERRVAERTLALMEANDDLQNTVLALEEQTEEALEARQDARAAEHRYRALVDGLAIGVVLMSHDGISAANPSAERILGLTTDQMRGPRALDPTRRSIHEDSSPFPGETHPMVVSLRSGISQRGVVMGIHRPDDTLVWIEVNSDPLIRPGEVIPHAAVGSFLDITERKQAEEELRRSQEQLQQAQKMEAIGQLAGGVAHDFNNLLTAITSYSELLLEDRELSAPNADDVREIKNAADRAAVLTRQLLAFSRRQMLQPKVINLNQTVAEMEKMLRRLIVSEIELETVLAPELWHARADPGQIEQVLMNLVVNARDAMPDRGTLTIETANVQLDEPIATLNAPTVVPPGEYVRLSVTDAGCGMDEATQAKMFEPFFTTKEPGKGTGLGLSTVYGIVKQSGGYVLCFSQPEEGTSFKVYLPRVDAAPEQAASNGTRPAAGRGAETILLVDDDDAVRSVTHRILSRQGYTVLQARNGADALRIHGQVASPIDLILSDMVMPEMGGPEMAREMRARHPAVRLLFMSGYAAETVHQSNSLEPGTAFMEKPFTPQVLLEQVRDALDAPSPVRARASASSA